MNALRGAVVYAFLTALCGQVQAQAPALAVVFDPSASALPAEPIRDAIARQLNRAVVTSPRGQEQTLTVATKDAGRTVVLRYPVAGEQLERSLPWSATSKDAVERIALLAQNLVEDQSNLLLDGPSPPAPAPAAPAGTAVAIDHRVPRRVLPASQRPTVQLTVHLALFNRTRLSDELRNGDARGNAGLAGRFELPVHRNLALGLAPQYEHWEGVVGKDELLVSPSDFMDLMLWARARLVLGALELSLPVGVGPSLMEELDSTDPDYALVLADGSHDEDAYPPHLGFVATGQLQALYWLGESIGVLLELGVEYHRATGREHEGLALTLNLIQPKAALGVSFAF